MGIPKFFRFISERWPLISQLIDGTQIPEFDNLYLDMNSILHTCTHSDNDTLSRMTDDQMYAAIFQYIEHLFEIIKPKEVFYMAIDGVAPRAKMNQQRARRFRTAYEAEENLKKAVKQGLEIPKEDPFDSNSITPGTEFMAKLTANLKYFIHKKISEDSNWANIRIVLSGHEVPGEGEHKIMSYIRTMKNQPSYNPNLRHCIYGLDADLIMLGLVTHDPHFALLREEVTFGPRSRKSTGLTDQNFFLLHINLLREYMELEFQDLDNQLNFDYDFEKVLDDFILIMYVIGNDFLPNLPDLFINKGAFPLLIETFKQSLKSSDGYINENGIINLKRLNIWLHHLSEFELENFEKTDVDVEWFNKKLEDISITGEKKRERIGKLIILKDEKKIVGAIKPWLMEIAQHSYQQLIDLDQQDKLKSLPLAYQNEFIDKHFDFFRTLASELGLLIVHSISADNYSLKLDIDGINPNESDEEHEERLNNIRKTFKKYQSANLYETDELLAESKDIYNKKFLDWKDKYYREKLHFSIHDKEEMVELTKHYIEGLQWVLNYYYKGCQSWNWYYKYHYAPRISDISIGLEDYLEKNETIKFEMSKPFKPFEQLMAVLPARSKNLMPVVYRPLMTDPNSPIIDFYPHEVDIDMNGKTASWEAVVLLSFVDEKKLIDVLHPVEAKLSKGETLRNSFGADISFVYNPQYDSIYDSPLPGFFGDIEHDNCIEEPFVLPKVKGEVKLELKKDAKLGVELLAGFPTLKSLQFKSYLDLNETKVFQNPSRSESMILSIDNIWSEYSSKQFSEKFLNKLVYTRWPYLRESRVVEIVDGEHCYSMVKVGDRRKPRVVELSEQDKREYRSQVGQLRAEHLKVKGVKLQGITGLVFVQPVNGLIRNAQGAYVKTFSRTNEVYPLELMVEAVANKDIRYLPKPPQPITEEFPVNSQAIFLGAFGYGAPSLIVGHSPDETKVNIKVSKIDVGAEVTYGKERLEVEKREFKYYASYDVCKSLKINALFLSKITSGFMVENDMARVSRKVNVGLELKFEGRRLKVLGYTRKFGTYWQFSPLAIKLLEDYKSKFPVIFSKLSSISGGRDIPKISHLGVSDKELSELTSWLKEIKKSLQLVSLESDSFTKFSFEGIENFLINKINQGDLYQFSNKDIKGVPREAILKPSESYQLLNSQRFELGDRVIYVQDFGKVPFLSKGTVASITPIGTKIELGIIFDYPLLSGTTMNGKLSTTRGLIIDSSFVLNLTNKQLIYHSKASKGKPVNRKPIAKKPEKNGVNGDGAKKAPADKKAPKAPVSQPKPAGPPQNTKAKNELLSLLNSKSAPAPEAAADEKESGEVDNRAIKQIYGQIYSNIMSEGIPAVPGIPLPPQFMQAPQPVPVPSQESNGHENGNGNRGRGRGRGGFRGRGRGRGRGKD